MRRRRHPLRHVYGAWCAHPITGRITCGYVGKSGWLAVRIREHMYGGTDRCPTPQPWADTVVAWKILFAGHVSRFTLWWIEVVCIIALRPLYNVQWNRLSLRRIPPYRAAYRVRSAACLRRMSVTGQPWRLRLLPSVALR